MAAPATPADACLDRCRGTRGSKGVVGDRQCHALCACDNRSGSGDCREHHQGRCFWGDAKDLGEDEDTAQEESNGVARERGPIPAPLRDALEDEHFLRADREPLASSAATASFITPSHHSLVRLAKESGEDVQCTGGPGPRPYLVHDRERWTGSAALA